MPEDCHYALSSMPLTCYVSDRLLRSGTWFHKIWSGMCPAGLESKCHSIFHLQQVWSLAFLNFYWHLMREINKCRP